jgi:hypothetical protein
MAVAIQGIRPVAHVPLLLGMLRTLQVAALSPRAPAARAGQQRADRSSHRDGRAGALYPGDDGAGAGGPDGRPTGIRVARHHGTVCAALGVERSWYETIPT